MDLRVFLLFVAIIAVEVIFRFLYRRDYRQDMKQLLNRIMAKDYKEYNYYEKKFDKDVEEEENIRDEAREERENLRKSQAIEEELNGINRGKISDLPGFEEEDEELPKEL